MTGMNMKQPDLLTSPSAPSSAKIRREVPSSPMTLDIPTDTGSPTGVENVYEDFMTKQQQQQSPSFRRLMADSSESLISPNHNREQRRLMALEIMRENSTGEKSLSITVRERLEQQLLEQQATVVARHAVLEVIRKQREQQSQAAANMEAANKSQQEKTSPTDAAGKYARLSFGLGVSDDKQARDTLRSFLGREGTKEKYMRMSQSFSGLSYDPSEQDESIAGGSMSRSEQRWQTRAEVSRLSSSVSRLSGGHIDPKLKQVVEEEEAVDMVEPDSESSESDGDDDIQLKDESISIVSDRPRTPVSAPAGQQGATSMPKGILKRPATVPAPTPLATQSAHCDNAARSRLSALYDEGKTVSLTMDHGTSHAPPRRRGTDGTKSTSANRRSNSDRNLLDGSSLKLHDGTGRHEGSSRKLRDGSSRHESDSKQLNLSSSGRRLVSISRAQSQSRILRGHRRTLEKSNSNSSRLSQKDESEEGNAKQSKRVPGQTTERSPGRKTERSPGRKTEPKSKPSGLSSSKSRHQRTTGGEMSSASTRENPGKESSSDRSGRPRSRSRTRSVLNQELQRSSGGEISSSSTKENPRKETLSDKSGRPRSRSRTRSLVNREHQEPSGGEISSSSPLENPRKESSSDKSERPRSRSRTRSGVNQERQKERNRRASSRSRSRARRRATKKHETQTDLPVTSSSDHPRPSKPASEDGDRRDKRTRGRRHNSDRNVNSSFSERDVQLKSSSRVLSESSQLDEDKVNTPRDDDEGDEGADVLQFDPAGKDNLSRMSMRTTDDQSNGTTPGGEHLDLADGDDSKVRKNRRKSYGIIMPLWGKKKTASSHQPMEASFNSSKDYT